MNFHTGTKITNDSISSTLGNEYEITRNTPLQLPNGYFKRITHTNRKIGLEIN